MVPYAKMQVQELPYDDLAVAIEGVIGRLCGWPDNDLNVSGRDIWLTPIRGGYERPLGMTIAINGSPTRGMLYVSFTGGDRIYYSLDRVTGPGLRPLPRRHHQVVMDFLNTNGFGPDTLNLEPAVCWCPGTRRTKKLSHHTGWVLGDAGPKPFAD